jgi:sec-independent protein translocase protein TatB
MFDIGWGELLLIAMVALIAIGPKELPGALRTLGHWMGKVRRMATEFQGQFQEALREAELHDLKKEVDDMAAKATSYTNFNPLDDVRKDIESAVGDLPPLHEPTAETATARVTSTGSEMASDGSTASAHAAPVLPSEAAAAAETPPPPAPLPPAAGMGEAMPSAAPSGHDAAVTAAAHGEVGKTPA